MNVEREKVVALIRVSTKEQAQDDRAGIARQRDVILRTIQAKNLNCIRMFEVNDVSGTNVKHCPEVQEILRLVGSGLVSGVVVADLDRLLRPDNFSGFSLLQVFQDTGAVLYCGDSELRLASKDGFLVGGIRAAVAGFELQLIKERMQGAKEQKRRQGKCPSAAITLPQGVVYDRNTERFSYTTEVAPVVEAFRLVDEEGIANYTELERRTGIHHRTLHNLLRNPIYVGIRRYSMKRGKEKYSSKDGRQSERKKVFRSQAEIIQVKVIDQPAVSQERFDRVQLCLGDLKTTWRNKRSSSSVNLAVGVGRCGYCGEPLYCSSGKSRKRKRQGYYFCKRNYYLAKRQSGGCLMRNIRHDDLDETAMRFAAEVLLKPDVVQNILTQTLSRRQVISLPTTAPTPKGLADLEGRQKRLLDAYEHGQIDINELERRIRKIKQEVIQAKTIQTAKPYGGDVNIRDLSSCIVEGALAFSMIKDPEILKRSIQQLFSRLVFQDDKIVSFQLTPRFAASCCQSGSRTGRGSWPPRA